MTVLEMSDCINATRPWSGKPVDPESPTTWRGQIVGFRNPGCRERFETAIGHFDALPAPRDGGRHGRS